MKIPYRKELISARERAWQCRDLELTFQWQRMVFLSAFILLLYTGYGCLLMQILSKSSILHHLIAAIMGFAGVIISSLFIMMGKGSKFWYEVYENRLDKILAKEKKLTINTMVANGKSFYEQKAWTPQPHGVEVDAPKNTSENLLSCTPYRYSPSKLNIILGQCMMISWGVIFIVHIIILAILIKPNVKVPMKCYLSITLVLILILIFFAILLGMWIKNEANSHK